MASANTKDMTHGTPWKLIVEFAFPVFLSQLFQQLYNTADTLIVGRFLGTEALAAVSSSGPLIFMLVSFFTGTSMGAGVVISRYFGAGDQQSVADSIHTNIAFGLVSGTLLTIAGVVFTPQILRWMDTDPAVLPDAIEYFRYYFMGALAVVMYNICKSIMNAVGDSKRPLYYLIFSSMVNIILDVLFIGVFHWGVWAAAVATTVSQALSVVLCFRHLTKEGTVYQVRFSHIRFHKKMLGEIVRYGLPAGIQNSVISFANVIVQTNINSFGKAATAAYGSYTKIEGFAFLPIISFTMALTTYVGQNLGARQYARAKQGSRFGIIASVVLAEAIGVVIFFTIPWLIRLFSNDPDVIAMAIKQARSVSLFYCLLSFSHAIASVCRGAGKAFVPMFVMLAVWCVLRITYITIIMHYIHQIQYIYWAYPLTWGISSVIYLLYYVFADWLHGFEQRTK